MNRKELLEKELNFFIDGVKKEYKPEKVFVFGSYVTGRVNDNSDLDVVVVAESKEPFWTRLASISKYCSNKVGMDVLFYTPLEFKKMVASRAFFRNEIQNNSRVVYEQK